MRWIVVGVALVATVSGGCAAIAARPPRAGDHYVEGEDPPCNTGKAAVGVDATIGVVMGLVTLGVASESGGAALVTGLITAAYTGSALYGSKSADRCRKWIQDGEAEQIARTWDEEPVPAPVPVPVPIAETETETETETATETETETETETATETETETETETATDTDWPDFWRVMP